MMNLNSHHGCILLVDLPLESRQRGHYDNQFKPLFIFVCAIYSFDYGFGDCVFNRNEKLVFNVDELFCVVDQLNIRAQY